MINPADTKSRGGILTRGVTEQPLSLSICTRLLHFRPPSLSLNPALPPPPYCEPPPRLSNYRIRDATPGVSCNWVAGNYASYSLRYAERDGDGEQELLRRARNLRFATSHARHE